MRVEATMATKTFIPWNSIAESIVDDEARRLRYAEALASTCGSCSTSPCCTHLPLHTFTVHDMMELDHIVYLLNFDRIELGLSSTGEWSAYYRYPCSFLDRQGFTCRVHDTPRQPRICVHYNPHHCWYRRVMTSSVSDDFLRFDRQRLAYLIDCLVFDDAGTIVEGPDWPALLAGVAALPLAPAPPAPDPPEHDPVAVAGRQLALGPLPPSDGAGPSYRYDERADPCDGCDAHCCKTLVFPHAIPSSRPALDYLRFCLGFPGIEVGIADDTWSIVVKTSCRHLQHNRCAVYGQPERPLLCKYYDAWKCTYRVDFGLPRPAGYLRLGPDQFAWLTECFRFDADGNVVECLPAEGIRAHIEARWREE